MFHKAGFKGKVVADRDKIPNAVANIGLAKMTTNPMMMKKNTMMRKTSYGVELGVVGSKKTE